MFESITLITICLVLFFAWNNKQIGLTSAVPKEPNALAHWQANQCLQTFKSRLTGATVKSLEETRIKVALKETAELAEFWSEGGNVFQKIGEGKTEKLHSLGPAGKLSYRMLSEKALFAKILADSGTGANHEVGVRLEVTSELPVAQPA